ncbi:hypothetical protein [Paenibacillus daejeonensis]|uniref:hypothetical protein n=1 Tax=Paenibacillus daejeonensis TaxID=135193 RepID=UPI00037DBF13|nr:hypothetical protein [Paenibacillus daejeonensis]
MNPSGRATQMEEHIISLHSKERWQRREAELIAWANRPKPKKRAKQTVIFGNSHIDAELLTTLALCKRMGIPTEYSCAGVSILDEPEDHSLYAYITFIASEKTEAFVQFAMNTMRHRLLVTFEPARSRYDVSSFYIQHNRSFCLLMEQCAKVFLAREQCI